MARGRDRTFFGVSSHRQVGLMELCTERLRDRLSVMLRIVCAALDKINKYGADASVLFIENRVHG